MSTASSRRGKLARLDLSLRERVSLLDTIEHRSARSYAQTLTSIVRALEPRAGWSRHQAQELAIGLADALDLRPGDGHLDTDAILAIAERLRGRVWVDSRGRVLATMGGEIFFDLTSVLEHAEQWRRRRAS